MIHLDRKRDKVVLMVVPAVQIVFQINQDQAQPRAQMVSRDDEGKEIPVEKVEVAKKPYQFLWVSILREYLAFEFKPEGPLSFEWDQERVYDDFGESSCCACHLQHRWSGVMPVYLISSVWCVHALMFMVACVVVPSVL